MSTYIDLAWCAGLYEGEGSVTYKRSKTRRSSSLRAAILSTDQDVMEMMVRRSGTGSVSGPAGPYGVSKKPHWLWSVHGDAAVEFLRAILPWLGSRRVDQIQSRIALWEDRPLLQRRLTVDDRAQVVSLRVSGVPRKQVADRMGVSEQTITRICQAAQADLMEAG